MWDMYDDIHHITRVTYDLPKDFSGDETSDFDSDIEEETRLKYLEYGQQPDLLITPNDYYD